MTKYLLPLLITGLLSINANLATAQNLPSEGDKTFEVMISPFSSSPISFEQFRFRSFQGSDMTYRLRGNLRYDSDRSGEFSRESEFYLELAPGVEWHAFQYNRLSMYYGGELDLTYNTSRQQISEDRTDKNPNLTDYFGVGVNAIVGLDVHFLQRLYTGMEVGYGLQMRNYLDAEINGNTVENEGREISLGSFFYPRLRLGVTF